MSLLLGVILVVGEFVLTQAVTDREVEVSGDYLRLVVDPKLGGVLTEFGFAGSTRNLALGGGLLHESFGVGSFYVPNRRINSRLEILDDIPGRPLIRFSYECEGPNIQGLVSTKSIEPVRDEASLRVTWKVENRGTEAHWLTPRIRNFVAPGGSAGPEDRLDMPTEKGIITPTRTLFARPSRNWIAITDPVARETVYAVFDADDLYAFQALVEDGPVGFGAVFVPRVIAPGESWETTFRIGAVRGLTHVSFATDNLVVQLDYDEDGLTLLLSSASTVDGLEFEGRVMKSGGPAQALARKGFSISPDKLVRCSYPWTALQEGAYDFLGQLYLGGSVLQLGSDTSPPHGGIDTRFYVGRDRSTPFEPWTDAPFSLERGPRILERTMAVKSDVALWFESPLTKVFREDVPRATGRVDPAVRLFLAQNERESFQVVLRPPEGKDLRRVSFRIPDLRDAATGNVLPASNVKLYRVEYVPVRIPSHFETPTGLYPDPLLPLEPFTAKGGECSPVWVTVHAPMGTPPGVYRGIFELVSMDMDPVELWMEVTVADFALPRVRSLKTDFGYLAKTALERAREQGYAGSQEGLNQAYMKNALEHGVTLRDLTQIPADADRLAAYGDKLDALLASGVSTISVPASLVDTPDVLRAVDAFVVARGIEDKVFSLLQEEPMPYEYEEVLARLEAWRALAPHIPASVTTFGLMPILEESMDFWMLHSQVFDTPNNRIVLEAIRDGREVWWYVHHAPPRPYGNFFVDFEAMEHRILFWQAWALGVRGFHYGYINWLYADQDPFDEVHDEGPANGNQMLVYPGESGPINSIRWETIRDGLDDYEYLSLLRSQIEALEARRGFEALLMRARTVMNLQSIVPDLVTFSREGAALEEKRAEMGRMIMELGAVL